MAKCDTTAPLGQIDLWSDVPHQRHPVAKCVTTVVRLPSGQMYPPRTAT